MDAEERLDRHGKNIAILGVRVANAEGDIDSLWKQKVSMDRYMWVERAVMALIGALMAFAFQVMTSPK